MNCRAEHTVGDLERRIFSESLKIPTKLFSVLSLTKNLMEELCRNSNKEYSAVHDIPFPWSRGD